MRSWKRASFCPAAASVAEIGSEVIASRGSSGARAPATWHTVCEIGDRSSERTLTILSTSCPGASPNTSASAGVSRAMP